MKAAEGIALDALALQAFLADAFPQVADQLQVETVTERGAQVRLSVDDTHLRPGGTVSGPTLFMLADVAMYVALLSRIGPVALAVTTGASIDFLRKPLPGHDVLAEVTLTKLGRRLAVGQVLMTSEGAAEPVAQANLTYALPPEK